ncbi:hypothetical protein GCM10010313_46780 [Streptomyces violarus]|nr:hypothetical protein GCM10010313_46780 [Streptomyces violarus]
MPGPNGGLGFKGRPLIDLTSPFSAPDGPPHFPATASPPPARNPFQAPDFGEDEPYVSEDGQ